MNEKKPPKDAHLNTDLHAVHDATYGSDQEGHDPLESVAVTSKKNHLWPLVWAIVFLVCILVTLIILFA